MILLMEFIELRCLLVLIKRRFDKKLFYCCVKESFGRFLDVIVLFNLFFDVKYVV